LSFNKDTFVVVLKVNDGEATAYKTSPVEVKMPIGAKVEAKIFLKNKSNVKGVTNVKANDVVLTAVNGVYTFNAGAKGKFTFTTASAGEEKLRLFDSTNIWEGTEITQENPQTDPEPQEDPTPTPTPAPTGNGCGSSVSGNFIYISLVAFALVGVAFVTKIRKSAK
ncbi:MAG: hypothetical protein MJ072_06740, partial [Clostridia bacterium]|nr:hypothetical protein [Clostridia bacterium]